jgi:acetyltransferase
MQDCVGVGVKSAIIISAGFKETGHEGAVLENEIMEIARGGNIRVIGPNCLGVMVRSSLVLVFICCFVAKAH